MIVARTGRCRFCGPAWYKSQPTSTGPIRHRMTVLTKSSLFRRPFPTLIAPLALLALAACGSTDRDEVAYVERPPEDIYSEALQTLEEGRDRRAANLFEEVERQHPYSQ